MKSKVLAALCVAMVAVCASADVVVGPPPGGGSGDVLSVFGRTGAVTAVQADYDSFFLTPAEVAAIYAPLASPTFTGVVTIPTPFTLGATSVLPTGTELNFVDGVTSAIQTQLDGKVNDTGDTMTGALLLPAGSVTAPSLAYSAIPGQGMWFSTNALFWNTAASTNKMALTGTELSLSNTLGLGWSSSTPNAASNDTILYRDAAGVLGLRNATTAQEFRVWGTTTLSKYLKIKHDQTNGIIDVVEPTATTGATQAGLGLTLFASDAVASTDTAGAAAGGDVNITAGAAARLTSGNANGGVISLNAGAGIGTGVIGYVTSSTAFAPSVFLGNQNAGVVNIGRKDQTGSSYIAMGSDGTAIGIALAASGEFGWSNGATATNPNTTDTNFSRIGPATVGVGNGTAGNVSGELQAASIDSGGATNLNLQYNNSTKLSFDSAFANFSSHAYGGGLYLLYGFKRTVNTASGSGNVLVTDNQNMQTCSATCTLTLEPAAAGYEHIFFDNGFRITIKPASGDVIIWTDKTSVSATGSIVTQAQYDQFTVRSIDATTWLASAVVGTPTVTP